MLLYTKNAINVFNVAQIEPWADFAARTGVIGDNGCRLFLENSFKTNR
jgi:hypothetical protein